MSLEHLKANSDKLNHHQKIGLKYVEDFESKIPRDEMKLLQKKIFDEASQIDSKFTLTVCGSFRRGAQFSNDIDILITHSNFLSTSKSDSKMMLDRIVNQLISIGFITDTLGFGSTKFMVTSN